MGKKFGIPEYFLIKTTNNQLVEEFGEEGL